MNTKDIFNTAVVGVGGTGKEVIYALRKLIVREFGSLQSVHNAIPFLSLDTFSDFASTQQESKLYMGEDISLREGVEVYRLALGDGDKRLVQELGYDKELPQGDAFQKHDFSQGAGGWRSYGRLAFRYWAKEIQKEFGKLIGKVKAGTSEPFKVIVVGSFMGGTGSGAFIDCCYLLRDQLKGYKDAKTVLYGIIGLPYGGGVIDDERKVNVFASLSELEYFNSKGTEFKGSYNGLEICSGGTPANYVYLVNHETSDGMLLGGPNHDNKDVYNKVAEHIFYGHTLKITASPVEGKRNDFIGMMDESPKGLAQNYVTPGISVLEIPIEQIYKAYIYKLCADIVSNGLKHQGDKEPVAVATMLAGLVKDVENPWDVFSNEIDKHKTEESEKKREKRPVRQDTKKVIELFVDSLTSKYGSEQKDNPGLLEFALKQSVTQSNINAVYEEHVEQRLNGFMKNEKFGTAQLFLEKLAEAIKNQSTLCAKNKESYTKDRNALYRKILERTAVIRDEILSVSLDDITWHIGELKELVRQYYDFSNNLIKDSVTDEFLKKLGARIKSGLDNLADEVIPALKNKADEWRRKYEATKADISKEYGLDIDDGLVSSKFSEDVEEKIRLLLSITADGIHDQLNDETIDKKIGGNANLKETGIGHLKSYFDLDRFLMDRERNQSIGVEESIRKHVKESAPLLMLNGLHVEDTAYRSQEKDSLTMTFAPKKDMRTKEKIRNIAGVRLDEWLADSNKIVFLREEAVFPLSCISFISEYRKVYETRGKERKSAYNHTVKDIYDGFLCRKLDGKGDTREVSGMVKEGQEEKGPKIVEPKKTDSLQFNKSEPPVVARTAQLNEFQLLHIGIACGLVKQADSAPVTERFLLIDEFGLDVPLFDEAGYPLPAERKFLALEKLVNSRITANIDEVKARLKEYVSAQDIKVSRQEFSRLYSELVEGFLRNR